MSNTLMGATPWMFKNTAKQASPVQSYSISEEAANEAAEITPDLVKNYIQSNEFRDQLIEIVITMAELQRIDLPNAYDLTDPSIGTDDTNPFDNIARAEIFKILNFRKLSKVTVRDALQDIADGQEPSLRFSPDESSTLLEQARELELITEDQKTDLMNNVSGLYSLVPENYKNLLNIQLKLPTTIPTEEELQLAGIQAIILETVRSNPESIVDEALIQQYTKSHIEHILMQSEFIGWAQTSKIIRNPYNIFDIINQETVISLLNRVRGYLSFVTEEKIEKIASWFPGEYDIESLFTEDQIRMVMDKELDIKNLVLKALSFEEVNNLFNTLSADFKTEFTEAFTEEKMKGLILAVFDEVFPALSTYEFLQEASTSLTLTTDSDKLQAISDRVDNMFTKPLPVLGN